MKDSNILFVLKKYAGTVFASSLHKASFNLSSPVHYPNIVEHLEESSLHLSKNILFISLG